MLVLVRPKRFNGPARSDGNEPKSLIPGAVEGIPRASPAM